MLGALPHVEQVFCFENRGEEIGVTLGHPHGQIYAYPFVTPLSRRMLGSARRHRERTWRNLFADVLAAEVADGSRVVHETEHWVAFVPAAARWPVEVHLYPRRQVPDLPALTDAERDDLAGAYRSLLRTLDGLYDAPMPYIAAWHQAPARVDRDLAHLHLELFSVKRAEHKLKYLAGSESGMGVWINDVTPEHIADRLRAAAGAGRHGVSVDDFRTTYRSEPAGLWSAPGRVNLIGEHTDYNDGFVLPFAIGARTRVAAAPRDDGVLRMRSAQQPAGDLAVPVADLAPGTPDGWGAYVAGVVWAARESGHDVGGMDLLVDGRVPLGGGLSSSHALECGVALAVNDIFGLGLDTRELALLTPAGGERLRRCADRAHGPARVPGLHDRPRPVPRHPQPGERARPARPLGRRAGAAGGGHPGAPRARRRVVRRPARRLRGGGAAARRPVAARRPDRRAGPSPGRPVRRALPPGPPRRDARTSGCWPPWTRSGRATGRRSARSSTARTPRCATTTRSAARSSTPPSRPRSTPAPSAPG